MRPAVAFKGVSHSSPLQGDFKEIPPDDVRLSKRGRDGPVPWTAARPGQAWAEGAPAGGLRLWAEGAPIEGGAAGRGP